MFTALDRIAAARAAPLTHRVTTTFEGWPDRVHDTRSLAAAETWAIGERRKIGRDLIMRNPDLIDGPTVRILSVVISEIAADFRIAA